MLYLYHGLENKEEYKEESMIKNMRCPACGRKRKPSHEEKINTLKAYSKDCKPYKRSAGNKCWYPGKR